MPRKVTFDLGKFKFDNEERLQHWAGWHPDPLERLRLQREHWLRWLKSQHAFAFGRFQRLTKKLGCEEDELVFYLYNLKFHQKAARVKEEEFGKMMERLEQAVEDLQFLTNSVLGFVLDHEWSGPGRVAELPHDLAEMLMRIESYADWVGNKSALLDDAKAAIVRHVLDKTKDPRHKEVSALVNTALEKHYTPEASKKWTAAHKMWVSRHRSLLKKQTQHEVRWLELKKLLEGQK